VLFTFPSRYLCTIGRSRVFSLGRWSSQLPTGFHGPHGTRETNPERIRHFGYRAITVYGRPFQVIHLCRILVTPRPRCISIQFAPTTPAVQRIHAITDNRFGLIPFRSSLLRESLLLSLPPGTEIFHFPGLASTPYGFRCGCGSITCHGFPHSGTPGSTPVSGFPGLFAAYYALHRLRAPRHPPYALLRLTTLIPAQMLYSSAVVKERCASKELCVRQVCSHHRHCRICRPQATSSSLLSCEQPHETLETPQQRISRPHNE
jgi:hypothetical protein